MFAPLSFGAGLGGMGDLFAKSDFLLTFEDVGAGEVDLTSRRIIVTPTFTRATTATTVLSTGLIGSVATGVPRSYYDPATLAYQGYLAEGARTNLCLRSEDFTLAWAAVGTPTNSGTVTLGSVTLQTIGDDSAAALEGYTQTITFTGDATKAISIFVKQGTSTSTVIRLRDTTAPADRLLVAITWSGTVPVVTMTTGTDLTGTPAQFASTGIYRLSFLATTVTAANTNSLQVYPATAAALEVANTGTISAGGVQAEDATFASSYIPTAAATVTRNADVLTYPTTGWYNAVEGTISAQLALEGYPPSGVADEVLLIVSDGTANEYQILRIANATNDFFYSGADGGVGQWGFVSGGAVSLNTQFKVTAAYKLNDIAACRDGGTVGTDSSGTLPTVTTLDVGGSTFGEYYYGPIRRVAYYNTRLANAVLQAMTA